MTSGRTFLMREDRDKGIIASIYRPILASSAMFKLLIVLLANVISSYIFQNSLYPLEQKNRKVAAKIH